MEKKACSSAKKLVIDHSLTDINDDSYYIFIDYQILRTVIERIAISVLSNSKVGIRNDEGRTRFPQAHVGVHSCECPDEAFTSSAAKSQKKVLEEHLLMST